MNTFKFVIKLTVHNGFKRATNRRLSTALFLKLPTSGKTSAGALGIKDHASGSRKPYDLKRCTFSSFEWHRSVRGHKLNDIKSSALRRASRSRRFDGDRAKKGRKRSASKNSNDSRERGTVARLRSRARRNGVAALHEKSA